MIIMMDSNEVRGQAWGAVKNIGRDAVRSVRRQFRGVWSVSGVYRRESLQRVSVIIMQSIFIIQDEVWGHFLVRRRARTGVTYQNQDFRP